MQSAGDRVINAFSGLIGTVTEVKGGCTEVYLDSGRQVRADSRVWQPYDDNPIELPNRHLINTKESTGD